MSNQPLNPETGETVAGPGRGSTASYPGAPRWVKVSGVIALVLVLVVVIGLVTGHAGPGRHMNMPMPSGGAGGHTPAVAQGLQRP